MIFLNNTEWGFIDYVFYKAKRIDFCSFLILALNDKTTPNKTKKWKLVKAVL